MDTHKASIDIRTPVAGTVERFLVEPGDEVRPFRDRPFADPQLPQVFETHPIITLTGVSSTPRVRMKSDV